MVIGGLIFHDQIIAAAIFEQDSAPLYHDQYQRGKLQAKRMEETIVDNSTKVGVTSC
jgi:hypothetical protein